MKRLLLTAAIVSSSWASSTATAQYFGPRLGFPGHAAWGAPIGAPIVLPPPPIAFYDNPWIGAIPRWSRVTPFPPVTPSYPVASYVPHAFSVNITPTEIDIRTPGFEYRAERHLVPSSAADFAPLPTYPGTGSLSDAAYRLAAALSVRPDGDVWLEYLQPERVAQTSDANELAELSLRYQGVIANPDLAWLVNLDGFREVLGQLSGMSREAPSAPVAITDAEPNADATPREESPASVETPTNENSGGADVPKDANEVEELPAPKAEPTTSV
ncbi:hypothetical protein [Neorhodopirellula pilleata]|uniref:Uncharacterized protein n=1 Tax=Neorhodopirellula pilleata TaxID=2714738 RepID=A0A5C5ZKG4_9BACT|nr:hypothetical protein [Neorhodopirellula pilleata]TWT87882.1 hypothetical protein Pla100_58310 [Neorhodopirellula pilleata]